MSFPLKIPMRRQSIVTPHKRERRRSAPHRVPNVDLERLLQLVQRLEVTAGEVEILQMTPLYLPVRAVQDTQVTIPQGPPARDMEEHALIVPLQHHVVCQRSSFLREIYGCLLC